MVNCKSCGNDISEKPSVKYWTFDYEYLCRHCYLRGYKSGLNEETDVVEYMPPHSGYVTTP